MSFLKSSFALSIFEPSSFLQSEDMLEDKISEDGENY
jgi:hypothetical protein